MSTHCNTGFCCTPAKLVYRITNRNTTNGIVTHAKIQNGDTFYLRSYYLTDDVVIQWKISIVILCAVLLYTLKQLLAAPEVVSLQLPLRPGMGVSWRWRLFRDSDMYMRYLFFYIRILFFYCFLLISFSWSPVRYIRISPYLTANSNSFSKSPHIQRRHLIDLYMLAYPTRWL